MNPDPIDTNSQTNCSCIACGCADGDHCGGTGCNYIIGVDPGVGESFTPRSRPKPQPNEPRERATAKQRRREAFGKQRPPGDRR